MIEPGPAVERSRALSIAEVILGGESRGGGRRGALAAATVFSLYAAVFFAIVSGLGPSAGGGSADMAARIHDAVSSERDIDLTPAPSPPPAPRPTKAASAIVTPRAARAARAYRPAPGKAAQAGQVAGASAAPADFTGLSFVVGSGSSYGGGETTAKGTSRAPGDGSSHQDVVGHIAPARDRSSSVTLADDAWSCPWPAEADAQQVNEQTVVLRVAVRADGRADRVDVLSDPGFGFGSAARSCALSTRFEPARDSSGQPIAADSPAIRVHFFR